MVITITELKENIGHYLGEIPNEDVYITKNGKQVAKIVGMKRDKERELRQLFGMAKLPAAYADPGYDPDYGQLRAGLAVSDERAAR